MEPAGSTAIAEYEPIAAALGSIEKYRGLVFEVTTPHGMKEAKAAHREVAAPRIALEKARTKLKADVLERGRMIDGEAKRIGALFAAIEDPIKAQIEAEERRIEAARQAAIVAEQERLAAEERARKEAEEAQLAAQRAEIARQHAALEAAKRQRDEDERARRAAIEAEDRARRAKFEEEERAARKRIEEVEAQARAARQAEEDRLRAERERLEAARREEEDRQRKAREALEAVEREERRKATELLDARGMLSTFRNRFGHLKPFAKVVKAIDALPAYLKEAA